MRLKLSSDYEEADGHYRDSARYIASIASR